VKAQVEAGAATERLAELDEDPHGQQVAAHLAAIEAAVFDDGEPLLPRVQTAHADLSKRRAERADILNAMAELAERLAGRGADPQALQAAALSLLDDVLDGFVAAREREGSALAAAIAERVQGIERVAAEVRGMLPAIRAGQRQKLEARLAELSQPADPGRVEQELVLWLQKLDVDEELDRLGSHVAELRRVLAADAPVGRRLDFLLQEFNREANTLGSKSVDARTSAASVELKVLIDQVREQAQNIE
jgi:uncharacterized protein (TIGR00255 family)